jgi:hypothetical protein
VRVTYWPDGAALPGAARLVMAVPADRADGGELTLCLSVGRVVRAVRPVAQLRDALRLWAAAALAGRGDLEIDG